MTPRHRDAPETPLRAVTSSTAEDANERDCTVVLADPDESARRRTRRSLQRIGFRVVAEAATGAGAVAATLEHDPDLCVLEIDLPGGGARATSEVLVVRPRTVVVIYTDRLADEHLFDALRAGASGYLSKTDDVHSLAASLRGVLAGEAAISRRLMRRVLEDYSDHPARGEVERDRLTQREWDVVELLRHGLTTSEIAERLFVAPVTVRTHIASIRRKLDAPDRPGVLERLDAGDRAGGARGSDLRDRVELPRPG
jgi:two-component system, NarL family, nitrate/nitrite response regulator NarL